MTTIHGYTNDQRLLDSFHKDFRRMRSAALNMFPTSTGASKAIGLVLPQLAGKIDGLAVRVPIPNVSLVDLTARMGRNVSVEEVENAFRDASRGDLKGILAVEWRSLVSSDYNGNKFSATVDLPTLKVIDNNLVSLLIQFFECFLRLDFVVCFVGWFYILLLISFVSLRVVVKWLGLRQFFLI